MRWGVCGRSRWAGPYVVQVPSGRWAVAATSRWHSVLSQALPQPKSRPRCQASRQSSGWSLPSSPAGDGMVAEDYGYGCFSYQLSINEKVPFGPRTVFIPMKGEIAARTSLESRRQAIDRHARPLIRKHNGSSNLASPAQGEVQDPS